MRRNSKFFHPALLVLVLALVLPCDSHGSPGFLSPRFHPDVPTEFSIAVNSAELLSYTKSLIETYLSNQTIIGGDSNKTRRQTFTGMVSWSDSSGNVVRFNAEYKIAGDRASRHITVGNNGYLISSISVNLLEGNVGGITQFKLLLPQSRNGDSEIFGTSFLESAGILTPYTRVVKVNFLNQSYVAIFQEKVAKEFIERWGFREGPLLEGDERQYWEGLVKSSGVGGVTLPRPVEKFLQFEWLRNITAKPYYALLWRCADGVVDEKYCDALLSSLRLTYEGASFLGRLDIDLHLQSKTRDIAPYHTGFFRVENNKFLNTKMGAQIGLIALTYLNSYRNWLPQRAYKARYGHCADTSELSNSDERYCKHHPTGRFPRSAQFPYSDIFSDVLGLFNGWHGMDWRNRKFYYDAILNRFIPIYYDGKLVYREDIFKSTTPTKSTVNYFSKYPLNFDRFFNIYKARGGITSLSSAKQFFSNTIAFLTMPTEDDTASMLPTHIPYQPLDPVDKLYDAIAYPTSSDTPNFIECIVGLDTKTSNDGADPINFSGRQLPDRVCRTIEWPRFRNIVKGKVFYTQKKGNHNIQIYAKTPGLLATDTTGLYYLNSLPRITSVQLTEENKRDHTFHVESDEVLHIVFPSGTGDFHLTFYLSNSNNSSARVLFSGTIPPGIHINVHGIGNSSLDSASRFDQHLLTGCLTIVDAIIDGITILATNLKCEDSVNIIRSEGSISSLTSVKSQVDGIDLDSSDIRIGQLRVNNSGNDCIDMSMGNYFVDSATLSNCHDKGISLGERGIAKFDSTLIQASTYGAVSKDFSTLTINSLEVENVKTCVAAFQKKQEFGPGHILVHRLVNTCDIKSESDGKSKIVIK